MMIKLQLCHKSTALTNGHGTGKQATAANIAKQLQKLKQRSAVS
jgi:hypothetical protein